eukprot:4529466-Prymnesium_polylepis.1
MSVTDCSRRKQSSNSVPQAVRSDHNDSHSLCARSPQHTQRKLWSRCAGSARARLNSSMFGSLFSW